MATTELSWITPEGSVANAVVGVPTSVIIQATNLSNRSDTITYDLIDGTLPIGMSFTNSGVLSGTPILSGASSGSSLATVTYRFVVRAFSSDGVNVVDGTFAILVTNSTTNDITWVTPSGSLGNVPNDEFYSLPLEVVSPPGTTVTFSFLSGELPTGMQVVPAGRLQGVPTILTAVAVGSAQLFRFTIRAKNNLNQINDRAFTLSVTSAISPIITPDTVYLGKYFDGAYYSKQLTLIDSNPNVIPQWLVVDGSLPNGLTLDSATGLISGYVMPLALVGDFGPAGYDGDTVVGSAITEQQKYDFGPYDFNQLNQTLGYNFTVQVYNGANYDVQQYQIDIVARTSFTADTSNISVDTTYLTVDGTNVYNPILLNDFNIPNGRQSSYYAYKFDGFDYQGDSVTYSLYNTVGAFDAFAVGVDQGFDYSRFDSYVSSVDGFVSLVAPTWQPYQNTSSPVIYYTSNPAIVGNTYNVVGNVYAATFAEVITAGNVVLSFVGNVYTVPTPSPLPGIGLDSTTGWLYGKIQSQSTPLETYSFGVIVSKTRDGQVYSSQPKIFNLSVYSTVNNVITWITPEDLGTIDNGTTSELTLVAESITGQELTYNLYGEAGVSIRLPQGLTLLPSGEISGRVSFETFGLDNYTTTFDSALLSIDQVYTFTVEATTLDGTSTTRRQFTLSLNVVDRRPYDNLYLKALPTLEQRALYKSLLDDTSIFDPSLIYRPTDKWFGINTDLSMLFLAGLNPADLAKYEESMVQNHFNKVYNFGQVKTAVALNSQFNVKYEVVYIEVIDPGEVLTSAGQYAGPPQTVDLTNIIANPYVSADGNTYKIVYPNSSENMALDIVDNIGYSEQNSLPEWMTSNQPDSTTPNRFKAPLGYTKAVVVAYTVPGASKKIAYRLNNSGIDFASIPFAVDRYLLDNYYTKNFDTATGAYNTGRETTFDVVPTNITGELVATVNYAVSVPFDQINGKTLDYIKSNGGIDGITYFRNGDTLVFAKQENFVPATLNDGWVAFETSYFGDVLATDSIEGYDSSRYETYVTVPGFNETKQKDIPVQTFTVSSVNVYSSSNNVITVSSTSGIVNGSEIIFTAPGAAGEVYAPTDPAAIPITLGIFNYNFGNLFAGNAFYHTYYVTNVLNSTQIQLGLGENPLAANAALPFGSGPVTGQVFTNQRGGVWKINIVNNVVNLIFIKTVEINQRVGVINGKSYGGSVLFYNNRLTAGQSVPYYSIYKYDPGTVLRRTTFNGDSTKFFDYRDQFYAPGSNDKYVKFPQYGVFE